MKSRFVLKNREQTGGGNTSFPKTAAEVERC